MRNFDARRLLRRIAPLVGMTLLVTACAPATGRTSGDQAGPAGQPAVQKTLTFGIQAEPDWLVQYGRVGTATPGPFRYYLWHGNLTEYDAQNNPTPSAAVKVPSLTDGDWKANPDRTMQVTWKIRPDVYWHDGTPLTSDDYVFGFEVIMNPQLTVEGLAQIKSGIAGVTKIDDKTFAINWKEYSMFGNVNNRDWIPAIPAHKLEQLYRTMDPIAFEDASFWREDLIGIGPYKLVRWEKGQFTESIANDQFFMGRPKIDRVIVKWVADNNVLVARILAGDIDIAPAESMIKPEQLAQIRQQWGPNKGQTFTNLTMIRTLWMNFREEGSWVKDVRFRQAMAMSINRQELVDVLQQGMTQQVFWAVLPNDPIRALVEKAGVPQWEYNPTRAAQLFNEAGWTKGTDGLLRDAVGNTTGNSTGQGTGVFYCCRYPSADQNDARESLAWGEGLKVQGFNIVHPIPEVPAALSALEKRKAQTLTFGGQISNWYFNPREHYANLLSTNIPTDSNKWTGVNKASYNQPNYGDLFEQRIHTLGLTERQQIEVQMTKQIAQDLPVLFAYYNPLGVAVREGIQGPKQAPVLNLAVSWNIYTWDID